MLYMSYMYYLPDMPRLSSTHSLPNYHDHDQTKLWRCRTFLFYWRSFSYYFSLIHWYSIAYALEHVYHSYETTL